MTTADIVIAEVPAMPRPPQPRLLEVLDEWRAVKLAMDDYERPSAERCGMTPQSSDHDASDPYWRQFVRRGEVS